MATQANLEFVQELYVAYYGRPADSAGQTYWAERADAHGQSAIVEAFGNSQEYREQFGDLDERALVNNLYQQLFDRDGDEAGVDYYAGVLERGEKSLAEIALTIQNGAQGNDAAFFDARVAEAQRYTDQAGDDYQRDEGREAIADVSVPSDASLDFVQEMYVAYYGRPADSEGQAYWAGLADAQGQSAIIEEFGNSQEYREQFGDLDERALVNNLYQQLFDREGDASGVDYYAGVLERGEKSLAEIALTIKNAASGDDRAVFEARTEAAQRYTDQAGDDYDRSAAERVVDGIQREDVVGGNTDTGGGDTDTGSGDTGDTGTDGGGDTDTGGGDTDTGGGDTDTGGGDTDTGGGDTDNGGGDTDTGGGDTDTGGGDTDNGGGDTDTGGGDTDTGSDDPVAAYNNFTAASEAYLTAKEQADALYTQTFFDQATEAEYQAAVDHAEALREGLYDGFTATNPSLPASAEETFGDITAEREALEDAVESAGGGFVVENGVQIAVASDGEEGGYVLNFDSEPVSADVAALLEQQAFALGAEAPADALDAPAFDGSTATLTGIAEAPAHTEDFIG